MQSSDRRTHQFREAISDFIQERRDAKLKGADDAETTAKYDYTTWLTDAARRVGQIQAVTHVLKATHPDARGSSVHAAPATLQQHAEIGTHVLGDDYADDIVGNAAALDVYKFLKLEVDSRRLLDWLQQDDADLLAALDDDVATAQAWAEAFKGLIREAETATSHVLAKQLYWSVSGEPCDDSGFHLLQPLFSSSLAHAVHLDINAARFGDANKAARQAKRNETAHDAPYADFRNLIIRKMGGTKPQNISQLNSERGGVNYLLASLPPKWDQDRPRQFLFIDSALQRLHRYEDVSELLQALCTLLQSQPEPTMETRIRREAIEKALGQALAAFGLATQQLFQPGWSRDDNCHLPLCERLWLDPLRADLPSRDAHHDKTNTGILSAADAPPQNTHYDEDEAFRLAYEWKDWPDEVAHRFGNWLNDILRKRGLPVGDAEHAHWAKQAIIDAEWPAPMQRRALAAQTAEQGGQHG